MSQSAHRSKVASKLDKAAKRAQRRQHISHDSDSDNEVEVEWGQKLHPTDPTATTNNTTGNGRRITRHSGLSNKNEYKSVLVNGTEYHVGQTIQIRSSSSHEDQPYLGLIFKLWENEAGEKQMVTRWLLRKGEMFLGKKKALVEDVGDREVLYSNSDDLVNPDLILGELEVCGDERFKTMSAKKQTEEVWVCRRYFNEHTAFVGELDWDEFYRLGRALDPVVEREMFAHVEKKKPLGKEAAALIGRAKVAARRARGGAVAVAATAAAATTGGSTARKGAAGRTKRRKADSDVDMEDNSENSGDEPDTEDESFVPAEMPPPAKDLPTRTASRTPARATRGKAVPATKRRMRLQDLQRPASVTATILKRTSKILSATGSTNSCLGKTIYETARQRLHVSAVPDTLPCREDEFAEIYGSLYNAIEERNSMCMYISGVPGTGKTATVYEVIRTLQENSEDGELSEFQYIELNGMKMTEPSQAYAQLWQAISGGEKATPRHAAQLLERHFSAPSPRRHTYVVLMDELDLLVTKSQSIMYNFFDWPHRPHAKLIVIAIANTMDLPERMLSHKVSSRLGLTRINFQPYTHLQLMTIVMSRLEGCLAFDSDAVELCARKISAVSGDARRALDVCRRAVEMVEAEAEEKAVGNDSGSTREDLLVTMLVIDRAVKEMYASGQIAFIQSAPLQHKVFLVALRAAIRKAGVPEVSLGDVAFIHRQLCQMHELSVPSYEQISAVCAQLGATRCVLAESSLLDVHQLVRLAIAEDDITVALRPDALFQKICVS